MDEVLKNLRSSTTQLRLENFQTILKIAQKIKSNPANKNDRQHLLFTKEASDVIWEHLVTGLPTTECQLMCATSFFTLLSVHEESTKHLQNVHNIIKHYYSAKILNQNPTKQEMLVVNSIIYGIYQSPIISSMNNDSLRKILENSLKVLLLWAYEYTEFTYITFKTLQNLRKLLHTHMEGILLRKEIHTSLLKVTCHNWENPITGVRDLNRLVFGLFLDMSDLVMESELNYKQVMLEINGFPWNKAKYLMLSEIVLRESKTAATLIDNNPDWLSGLILSLTTSSLVSAGADMYLAVLKKTNTDSEWCHIFLDAILKILTGLQFKTIENFNNYWCMNTLKQFHQVLDVLSANLHSSQIENTVYAHLSILRQGNKLGLVNKPWPNLNFDILTHDESEITFLKTITEGLEHININIRVQTFEIICIAHNNALPTNTELDLILKYIDQNVNSDSTVLRLNMLNNIKLFFTRLHISTMNKVKSKMGVLNLKHVLKFCASIQNNLALYVKMHGNYQRNITATKLCNIFLSSFSKPLQRKRNKTSISPNDFTLKRWLMENQMWFLNDEGFVQSLLRLLEDPADDVRETISETLLSNYLDYFTCARAQGLMDNSLKNIQSKYFYEVSSGHCGMKLVSNLLLKLKLDDLQFPSIEDVFQYFFNNLISEQSCANDVLLSIETGKALHSLICILQNILEVCLQNSYPMEKILTENVKKVLVEKLSEIPKLYSSEEGFNCNPDFSEMSAMVEQLISLSACTVKVEDLDVKISDRHQIVLNCIWLNLKACCDLLSLLVKCMDNDVDLQYSDACLQIIANVLETSRHKGAIEAAGVAIGKSIKHLSSSPRESELSSLPMKLLKGRLEDLIYENKMVSTTRRGAGLSIMLHKIVSNDMVKGKPLFHYAINMLMKASSTSNLEDKHGACNERDIPKAIYIHLMTKIVADSTLASDVMYYSASLAELAFSNLTSEQWQIRNAALQLYGALVPKLIGQKKSATNEDGSAATVGSDELRTHFPKLWIYIERQLELQDNTDDIIQAHSNLVPILNILASTAKKYNFCFDSNDNIHLEENIFKNLMRLLNSPIYTVRRLTAKSVQLMYPFKTIHHYILETKIVPENLLHGFLMLTKFYKKLPDFDCDKSFVQLENHFRGIMNEKKYSYVVKSVFYEHFLKVPVDTVHILQTTLDICNKDKSIPGVFMWANVVIQRCVEHCHCKDISYVVKLLLNSNDVETYCDFILKRIECDDNITKEELLQIVTAFMECKQIFEFGSIWKIFYVIACKDGSCFNDNLMSSVFEYLEQHNYAVAHKMRYIIPFVAKLLVLSCSSNAHILKFSSLVNALTDYETADVDMRYMAALANNYLGISVRLFPRDVKFNLLKSALNLLQDDEDTIRFEAAHFYSNAINILFQYQPYICLQNILDYKFLCDIFEGAENDILKLTDELLLSIGKEKQERSYNPFVVETRNIYAEPQVFMHYINIVREKIEILCDD